MSTEQGTGSRYAEQVAQAEAWAVEQTHGSEDTRVMAAMVEHADESGLVPYMAVGSVARACGMTRSEVGEVLARLFRAGRWIGRQAGLQVVGHLSPCQADRGPDGPTSRGVRLPVPPTLTVRAHETESDPTTERNER